MLNGNTLPVVGLGTNGVIPSTLGKPNRVFLTDENSTPTWSVLNKETLGLGNVPNINPQDSFSMNSGSVLSLYSLKAENIEGIKIVDRDENISIFVEDGGKVAINHNNPDHELHVNGTTKAEYFIGDGRHLTNLSANNISSGTISNSRLNMGSITSFGIIMLSNSYSSTSTDVSDLHVDSV